MSKNEWLDKNSTITNQKVFDRYQIYKHEIVERIESGLLQYRKKQSHGEHYLLLLKSEIKLFAIEKHGGKYVNLAEATDDVGDVYEEIMKQKKVLTRLEMKKNKLEKKCLVLNDNF
jgi:hypothetical protein